MMISRAFTFVLVVFLIQPLLACQSGASTDEPSQDANGNGAEPTDSATAAEPPIGQDQQVNVYIPAEADLLSSLRVAVVYNDSEIQVRYEYETQRPSWYHDYLVFEDGRWERLGDSYAGPNPHGLAEDRISMALDDGSVDGFPYWGGYVGMHQGVASRTDEAPEEIEKFLAMSREGELDEDAWQRRVPQEQFDALRDAGTFLQTWQWRAHRSNPVGYADPGFVLAARHGADGRSMYETNWDGDEGQPMLMFDPERANGARALRRDALLAGEYGQDDPYFLERESALPFDPQHDWQEGDVLPRRFVQQPEGSRGALRAQGRYEDGAWRVRVTRSLQAPNPRDSKTLEPGRHYHVAFAVHANATQGRWHYVSMPLSFSLDEEADLQAVRVDGPLDEADAPWLEVPLFYPGQVYLAWLLDNEHEVHQRYAAARVAQLDPARIQALAQALAEHELAWLREMGITVSPPQSTE